MELYVLHIVPITVPSIDSTSPPSFIKSTTGSKVLFAQAFYFSSALIDFH